MKFSLSALSAVVLAACAVNADEYANAMKEWCGGLTVPFPDGNTPYTTGSSVKVTVNNAGSTQHKKTITGLDLYTVPASGSAKYVENVWSGTQAFSGKVATLTDSLPSNLTAGNYYYRVWVTNSVNGMHGPDCLQTSHTFKVSSGSHTNSDGNFAYNEDLSDEQIYNSKHGKGCFGLTVSYPQEGAEYHEGDHVRLTIDRDSSSQTETLQRVSLYKVNGEEQALVQEVWTGTETLSNTFTLKDHMQHTTTPFDASATYFYKVQTTSDKHSDVTCDFNSHTFKIVPKA
ncbi:hypothetical protein DM01DRAFT_1410305 [Hesseltinella vesiculosa]|uniref:Uncharacterized protein n=1 Tax=Hesseltinella vesiculosa TaxID=101127 RepID=A0A1X2G7P1_9FUNG|nr:hypothetical protein DM01DRAFT_1410305 [Hesseltinella vesiculosa]